MGELFDALEARAQSIGVYVSKQANFGGEQAGFFKVQISQRDGREMMTICVRMRSGHVGIVDDVSDSLTLAHELGHHQRHVTGVESAIYRNMVDTPQSTWPQLSLEVRRAVIDEERGAWDIARNVLQELNFTNWSAFDSQRETSLRSYLDSLGFQGEPA